MHNATRYARTGMRVCLMDILLSGKLDADRGRELHKKQCGAHSLVQCPPGTSAYKPAASTMRMSLTAPSPKASRARW